MSLVAIALTEYVDTQTLFKLHAQVLAPIYHARRWGRLRAQTRC